MWYIVFGGTINSRHQLNIVKIFTPIVCDRSWIFKIGFVEFFYVRRVTAEEVRATPV
jgi:hypothetical protein